MSPNQTSSPDSAPTHTEVEEATSPNRISSPDTVVMQSPVLRTDSPEYHTPESTSEEKESGGTPEAALPAPPPGLGPFQEPKKRVDVAPTLAIVSGQMHQETIMTTFPGQIVRMYIAM